MTLTYVFNENEVQHLVEAKQCSCHKDMSLYLSLIFCMILSTYQQPKEIPTESIVDKGNIFTCSIISENNSCLCKPFQRDETTVRALGRINKNTICDDVAVFPRQIIRCSSKNNYITDTFLI